MNKVASPKSFERSLISCYFQDVKVVSKRASQIDASLVEKHLKDAVSLAYKHIERYGLSRDLLPDLIQAANLELVKAAKNFNGDKGHFAPYAAKWIKGAFSREVRFLTHSVDISENMVRDIRKVLAAKHILDEESKRKRRSGCESGIASILGWEQKQVEYVLQKAEQFSFGAGNNKDVAEEEDHFSDDEESRLSGHDPAADLIKKEMQERVQSALTKLPVRERKVIEWRMGFKDENLKGETLEEIGKRLGGIKKQSVAEIEKKAKEHLREHLADLMAA
ncbi:MAG: sigma-70 family RNA polymerase sigma factor [Hungatella sp.]|jgi:RNA polymerase sigma factor (sigma-70 family)|nr:sigma-70 family RNA polymerase sigma factor [Hungatella sp.]